MSDSFTFAVDEENIRLDQFLVKKLTDVSRSKIQLAIKSGQVLVDGEKLKSSTILKGVENVEGELLVEVQDDIIAEDIPLNILYEDDDLAIINKISGMVVHPGSGNYSGTLVNALVFHFQSLSGLNDSRPGIVHRLDKDTSGVIVIAKNDKSHQHLSRQFAERKVKKVYKAIAWGGVPEEGEIEGLIGRHPANRKAFKMVNNLGRKSLTAFMVEEHLSPLTFVTLHPKTGRTHQIRVHLKSIGHPILADEMYGGGKKMIKSFHVKYTQLLNRLFKNMNRVALHAEKLEVTHPTTGKKMRFQAPIPDDMVNALNLLRNAQ
ncbi:MAG: RluA family pseudouridine synthase [Candidatus Marinimicrobia bacterium]|nr:RluA family pseudouridine synthase [Candidatus Neomarinimicrobiota bacterium]